MCFQINYLPYFLTKETKYKLVKNNPPSDSILAITLLTPSLGEKSPYPNVVKVTMLKYSASQTTLS